jgi:hypothetical protein
MLLAHQHSKRQLRRRPSQLVAMSGSFNYSVLEGSPNQHPPALTPNALVLPFLSAD